MCLLFRLRLVSIVYSSKYLSTTYKIIDKITKDPTSYVNIKSKLL